MPFFNASTTLVGNIVRDPELRYTPSGKSVVDIGMAVNYSRKVGDKYEDDASFFDLVVWGELGEHAVESLKKGDRIIVVGTPKQQRWETPEGDKRSRVVINVDNIGPDLTWATAAVTRTQSSGGRGPSAAEMAAQQEAAPATQQQQPAQQQAPEPTYDYSDEPFRADVFDWLPGVWGAQPERMLP